jgi:type VI secretion system lysozyme-like protein
MVRLRLFERLSLLGRNTAGADVREAMNSSDAILKSICDYVAKLLNSREGSTLLDPSFGMPDFTHAGAGFSADDEPLLRARIADFIGKKEPRLTDVQIIFAPREATRMALSFSITAALKGEDEERAAVRLYSDVTQQGKVDVRL